MENTKGNKTRLDKYKLQQSIITVLPFAALVILFIVFCIVVSAKGYRLDMYLKIIFNEGIVLAVVATGAIFIYTLGTFDISLGAATLFAATIGVTVYNATNSFALMILMIFVTGIACSLFNSVLASVFHIPAFVTTVAMMSVLSAVASQIITTNGGALGGISIPSAVVKPFDVPVFKIVVLVVFMVVCFFVFQLTKVGRRQKFIGGNPICAELTGINYNTYAIIAFVMAGIGVGLGAFLTLVYTPSVTTTTASGIGMNIFIAIVFGGMPISGGARSRIHAALVGGFSFVLLNDILELLIDSSAAYGITQLISAIFFLVVVYITSMNYRTNLLPR
jgi:ribose transport system permease protein